MSGLQTRIYSLDYTPRVIRATEEILDKLYNGSKIGLKNENLAYHAGLSMSEYRQLEQFDPRVEHAVLAGRSDDEREMASVLRTAALNGDSKAALEVLKHRHNWAATQLVKNEVTGAGGGPITLAAVDFRGLSNEELQQMKKMLEKSAQQGDD